MRERKIGGLTLHQSAYAYDSAGNVTEIVGLTGTRTFVYDPLERLVAAGTAIAPESYGYDAERVS